MSIGLPISGLRSVTPQNLVLDAGIMYKNINEAMLQNGLATAFSLAINPVSTWTDPNNVVVTPTKLGATRGGTKVKVGITQRQVDFDSKRSSIKGFDRVDMISPSIDTMLLEFGDYLTAETALGSTLVHNWTTYQEVKPSLVVASLDFIGNIAVIAPVSGSLLPIVVVLRNARVNSPGELDLKDKSEMAYPVSFTGNSLASDQYNISISFYVPATTSPS